MPPSALLFIDGSNFYHSLRREKRLPFGADDFQDLFDKISERYELKAIYFYDAVKNSKKDPAGYSRQQAFHARLERSNDRLRIKSRKLRYLVNITDDSIMETARRVGIVDSCKDKLKRFLLELGILQLSKEKGIDVLLVVDAIEKARERKVDAILLLSGDADFVPAIDLIKSYKVKTVNLHTYSGSSTELRNACDERILIDFDEGGLVLE